MQYTMNINNKAANVQLRGQLSYDTKDVFQEIMGELEAESVSRINFNMNQVDFIDSAGLGMLLLLKDRFADASISISGAKDQVNQIITLTKLDKIFNIH